ncbi:MAG: hypothetical protein ACYC3W_09295 [Candidatus Nanopelagicales bacterium]
MNSEEQRIAFLLERDGLAETLSFCRQTLKNYRTCVLQSQKRKAPKRHHASLPEYRRGFIESYVVLKRFLAHHNAAID